MRITIITMVLAEIAALTSFDLENLRTVTNKYLFAD